MCVLTTENVAGVTEELNVKFKLRKQKWQYTWLVATLLHSIELYDSRQDDFWGHLLKYYKACAIWREISCVGY